jgi:hypothetical protein
VVPNHTPFAFPRNGECNALEEFEWESAIVPTIPWSQLAFQKSDKRAKDQARKSHQCRASVSEDASTLLPGWLMPQQSEGGVLILIAHYMGVVPNHTPNTHWLNPRSGHTTSKKSTTPRFEKRGFVTLTTNR